jgi:hypothetical protein
MHPDLIGQIATQHTDELRKSAAQSGRGASVARPPHPSIRNRAGWTLVHIGLRLAAREARSATRGPRPRPAPRSRR